MIRIAIFASGRGSNALSIIRHFSEIRDIEVSCVCSNNPNPGVFEHAESFGIEYRSFSAEERAKPEVMGKWLSDQKIDFVVLAGYMKKVPQYLLKEFENKVLNIHPALLPGFGGKGMYGMNVHEAVVAAGESESGITIHLVNEEYDKGRIIFQEKVKLAKDETAASLAKKVLELEHKHYPQVIEEYIRSAQ